VYSTGKEWIAAIKTWASTSNAKGIDTGSGYERGYVPWLVILRRLSRLWAWRAFVATLCVRTFCLSLLPTHFHADRLRAPLAVVNGKLGSLHGRSGGLLVVRHLV